MMSLADLLSGSPYQGYCYAYPHKMAYRGLDRLVPLHEVWAGEDRSGLFLYFHVPFCESRCGYCNLFSQAGSGKERRRRYLHQVAEQAARVRKALGPAVNVARLALGGGTPTILEVGELQELFRLSQEFFDVRPYTLPVSVEASPRTATREKLAFLREQGVTRLSLGVQTFAEQEARAINRRQERDDLEKASLALQSVKFPVVNIDLIYGLPGQTPASWLESLEAALALEPQELYLYPLYVRPLTGLGKRYRPGDDLRLACYREACSRLNDQGYVQVSMRLFRRAGAPLFEGPHYCCQEDGMIGLGCGARSYTRRLHYSGRYAVTASGIRKIMDWFLALPGESFSLADYGFRLDGEEQRRRFVIKSLLQAAGLSLPHYQQWFGSEVLDDLPELAQLEPQGLAETREDQLCLTAQGLERSDAIGPWLYSARVRQLMQEQVLR